MKTKLYFILFLHLIFAGQKVEGFIYDLNNNPISNASVSIPEISSYAISNQDGYFLINIDKVKDYKVIIEHIGYKDYEIIYSPQEVKLKTIILKLDPILSKEIQISENTSIMNLKDTPIVTHVITEEKIKSSGSSNVIEVLENTIPNIQFIWDPHGVPTMKIQGYQTNNIAFLIDGQRISGEHAGNVDFEMINLSNIQNIEVIRGGMSTLYGSGAVGGIVNLISKQKRNSLWFEYSLNNDNPMVINNSINIGLDYKKINFALSFSNKYSAGYDLTPASEFSSGRVDKTLDENKSNIISSNFNYKINQDNKLSFYIKAYDRTVLKKFKTSGADEILYNIETGSIVDAPEIPIYTDINYILKYSKVFNKKTNFMISYQNEYYSKDIRYPYYYGSYPVDKDEEVFDWGKSNYSSINAVYKTSTFNNHILISGFEAIYNETASSDILDQQSDVTYPSIFSIDTTYTSSRYSIFIADNFKYNDNLYINSGIRINYNDRYKFKISPSIGMKKDYNNHIFRINLSSNYRSPTVKELYYEFPEHSPPIYGNPDLNPQTSNYFSFSYEDSKSSSLEFYYSNDYNRIGYRLIDPNPEQDGDSYYESDNFNKVVLYGMNTSWNFNNVLENTSLLFTFSITDAPSQYRFYLDGVSKYSFKTLISYSFNDKVKFTFSNRYLSDKTLYGNKLDEYSISNALIAFSLNPKLYLNIGVKNIFDYKDPRRQGLDSPDILTSYDPGQRFYFNLIFNFKKELKNE